MTELSPTAAGTAPFVELSHLNVEFRRRRFLRPDRVVHAVNDVSFTIGAGETLGLVGESGSGKSTTGRALLHLAPIASGEVRVEGRDVAGLSGRALRDLRGRMQMVFQDPYSSLDPSATVGASIAEPMRVHQRLSSEEISARVAELLDLVGLKPSHAGRYPYEFSGGQRQRVAIARALALNPALIVCDEAVSALDVSTRNQIINLFEDLRDRFDLSYLFIAHDLSVVRHIAHRVAVMYLGRIVEIGPTERIYSEPAHPYTQALLSAVPVPDPRRTDRGHRIMLSGDLPDPAAPPPGCPFQTRCPYTMPICKTAMPDATPIEGGGVAACHLQSSGPTLKGASLNRLAAPS